MTSARAPEADGSPTSLEARFRAMHRASRTEPPASPAERREHLRALRRAIGSHIAQFQEAIARDFGSRSHKETLVAEIIPALTTVREALRHVGGWMAPERRGTSILFWPGRNEVRWQPKGVVLIVAPWNYPVSLSIGPLAAALAAGNRVVLKPSEFTPATSDLLERCLEDALGADRVTVATGGPEIAQALCRLPFDHILFTGSTAVGRKVMAAAAENLTPVTLELGGKSPAIVHPACDLATAASRIARGKLMNAGQTCIAPDYALIHENGIDAFVRAYRDAAARLYPRLVDNRDYTSIVNARHYDRLCALAADAREKGARIEAIDPAGELPAGEIGSSNARKIAPLVLTGVGDAMAVMQEEIFGPLLPIVAYRGLDDAIAYVRAKPRPLALYYFDSDRARVGRVLDLTVSGGVTVNDTIYHFAQESLPFGGIGPSGMGAYHGREGFRTFSHAKAVFRQGPFTLTDVLAPPYGTWFDRLTRLALRRARRPR
jgi:acyl-CoA reductase-like NAD-dependent aldehyde dehydrogenase